MPTVGTDDRVTHLLCRYSYILFSLCENTVPVNIINTVAIQTEQEHNPNIIQFGII